MRLKKEKLSFKFKSEFLNYQPYLKNFSSQHYKIFDELALKLDVQGSIDDLFAGKVVNKTENKPALHHQYRINQQLQEFNFKKITEPFIKKIKKNGFKNIITFGIGGSYEGPKLIQEYTKHQASKLNYYFISGPDRDEFNSILKPLSGQKNLYIFSSKSLSTDETLLCLKWLGKERNSTNSLVITANSKKAKTLDFPEDCIVPFPETVGGRYSIWSPISLSAALENNFSLFLKGGFSADKMMMGTAKEDRKYQKFIKTLVFSDLWFSNFRIKKIELCFPIIGNCDHWLIIFSNWRWNHLGSSHILVLFLKKQASRYLEALALLLSIPTFNYCIRVQQNFVQILFIQIQAKVHYHLLKQKGRHHCYRLIFRGLKIYLKKQIVTLLLIFFI